MGERRVRRGIAAAVAIVLAATACTAGEAADGSSKPELTVGVSQALVSLDPAKDRGNFFRTLSNEALLHLEEDGSFSAGLATSWGYVDGSTSRFELTLRKDAKFSDGSPVDAKAVKTWFEYFIEAGGPGVAYMGKVASIEAVDERKVRINLAEPNPSPGIPLLLAEPFNWGSVSSPKAVANPDSLGNSTAGAGPYVLDAAATVTDDHYTFVPNEHYYDRSRIRYSKVTVRIISDPAAMLQAASTGQLDVAEGDFSTVDAAKEAGLAVAQAPFATQALFLTDKSGALAKPLADVRVRQALNHAIDRKAIMKASVGDNGTTTSQMPSIDGYDKALENHYDYDPEKARALLAEAGYADGFELKILNGESGSLGEPFLQLMAKYFAEVGVTVDITTPTADREYVQKLNSQSFPVVNQPMRTRSMYLWYKVAMRPGATFNWTDWHDPDIDRLWEQGGKSAKAAGNFEEISRLATKRAHFIPVFKSDMILYYARDDVAGVSVSERGMMPHPPSWSPRQGG